MRTWTSVESSPEMLRVLLTNDDGIDAEGLQALRRALVALDDVELAVIAPDGNRSATARSITFRRPLWVAEIPFEDGTFGYACDGTPVDCVRLASLSSLLHQIQQAKLLYLIQAHWSGHGGLACWMRDAADMDSGARE